MNATNQPAPLRRLCEYSARPVASLHSYAATAAPEAPTAPPESPAELSGYWSGILGVEGELTGDGRLLEEGALEWSTPIPLRYVQEDVGGHDGAVVVGRILSIWRAESGALMAHGDFDLGGPAGREASRLLSSEMLRGVSMDLDSVSFEVRVSGDIMAEMEEEEKLFMEAIESGEAPERPALPTDEEGRVTVHSSNPSDEVMVTTSGRIRAATMVSVPAFATAVLQAETAPQASPEEQANGLTASAAPVAPPEAWFMNPQLSGPTPLMIDDSGRVYGHLATWDVCHVADPSGAGVCVMAPKSMNGYAYFHTGAVKTAEGSLASTGVLRFNTQHASLRDTADSAAAHYDHTGLAGADVHVGEDKFGIWVAGALRPGLSDEQVRTLRASPLSGDWRYVNGGALELVGALAVNLPGFPIPRPSGLVASGELQGLVAAGMVVREDALETLASTVSASDARYLARLIDREKSRDGMELRARVSAARGRQQVASFAAARLREKLVEGRA